MTDEYVLAYHGPLLYEARVSGLKTLSYPIPCFCCCFRDECGGEESLMLTKTFFAASVTDFTLWELDGEQYFVGICWSPLLYPLQRLETDVSRSAPNPAFLNMRLQADHHTTCSLRYNLPISPNHKLHMNALNFQPNYSWDEWVPEQRLLKLNEAGFAKRRQLLEAQTKKNRPSAPTAGSSTSPVPPAKGEKPARGKKGEGSRKRARDSAADTVSLPVPWHLPFFLSPFSRFDWGNGGEEVVVSVVLPLLSVGGWRYTWRCFISGTGSVISRLVFKGVISYHLCSGRYALI